jgi:hypothetical protein
MADTGEVYLRLGYSHWSVRHLVLRVVASLAGAAALLGAPAVAPAQARAEVTLAELTIPASELPLGCTLPANVPIDQRGMTRLPAGATNPWYPTESTDLTMVHHMVAGFPRVPDGPPPMPRDARRFGGSLILNMTGAYAAVYTGPGEADIRVWAAQYAGTPPPVGDQRHAYRVREHFTLGSIIALVDAANPGPCFEAVRAHVRQVMQPKASKEPKASKRSRRHEGHEGHEGRSGWL